MNFTSLRSTYSTLRADYSASMDLSETIQASTQDGIAALNMADTSLSETQTRVSSFRSALSGIRSRLGLLADLVNSNLEELEKTSRSTAAAVELSQQVDEV